MSDCYFHGYEADEGAYRVCFECGHVYRTEGDLVEADYDERVRWLLMCDNTSAPPVLRADDIYSCPVCTHDF